MRHILTFLLLCNFTFVSAQQGVAINTDGSTPDEQAILDIKSINRGLLLPRMTTAQRNAISSPIAGLLVYDTDRQRIYQSDAGTWRPILNGRYWNRSASGNYTYNTEDSIGIGTASPDEKLEILNGKIKLNQSSNNTENYNTINFNAGLPSGDYTRQQGLNFYTNGITKGKLNFISSSNNGNSFRFSVSSTSAGDLTINEEGHVGIGTQFPSHVLDINGVGRTGNTLRLAHAGSPIIQLAGTYGDKGFIKLSGDDLHIGINSENTEGKFIVRTNGANQLEIDGTSGSNIMRLYSSNIHRGTISALNNNNIRITTAQSNGLLILNDVVYVNNTSDRTGIGTTTPDEKLHVFGNVKIENGKLNKPATGTFNMMPLCYGRINANGTIHTATPNVSIDYQGDYGHYYILCPGITEGSVIHVTVYGSTRYIGTASYVSSGKALVSIENITQVIENPDDDIHYTDPKSFYFIIYNQ